MRGALTPEIVARFGPDAASGPASVDCDPQVIESAVYDAVRGTPLERDYQRAREACYSIADFEARDRAFAHLNNDWFARLRLAEPVLDALAEFPNVAARTARCVLAPAVRRSDEGAELYENTGTGGGAARPYLVVRLRPDSFRAPAHVAALLRHELMHIEDMLDPAFGYDPSPAQFLGDDGVPTLIRDRYRVLWDTYIDGRLHRAGRVHDDAKTARFAEFRRVFKPLGARAEEAFETVFASPALSHAQLLSFCRRPSLFLELAPAC